jgi:hypothetical protein
LHLTRREYYQALDILLQSGYWNDAAYVAECVLTADELMAYTDRHWPALELTEVQSRETDEERVGAGAVRPQSTRAALRHLAARRLARLQRWEEALDFYPAKWQDAFQSFVHALQDGREQALTAEQRAKRLWAAAQVARHQGMELFGTELEPDWFVYDGQYENTPISSQRNPAESGPGTAPVAGEIGVDRPPLRIAASSADERRRIRQHQLQPARRFHYRYLAAELAWEAAQLMPDHTDETAFVLWQAGSWMKARDPIFADRFYKALVVRCGNTPLGAAADQLRWFPTSSVPAATEEFGLIPDAPTLQLEMPSDSGQSEEEYSADAADPVTEPEL